MRPAPPCRTNAPPCSLPLRALALCVLVAVAALRGPAPASAYPSYFIEDIAGPNCSAVPERPYGRHTAPLADP